MDSKLKRLSILTAILAIFTVGLIVVLTNRDLLPKAEQGGAVTSNGTPEEGQSADAPETVYPDGFAGSDPSGRRGASLSAFLKDETFFDREKSNVEKQLELEKYQLYFMATSVEHDMRIQVLNYKGLTITGVPFVVNIQGLGKYKDEDEDGILYLGGLKAGKYVVSLEPVESYHLPEAMTVYVKDRVEYTQIGDISLLIKTEEDIIAEEEDTAFKDVMTEDVDDTELTDVFEFDGNGYPGIDVSKWNGEIDWQKVKEAGINFAVIRVGYRGSSTGAIVEDPYYKKNIEGALAAGIRVGLYFFTQAVDEREAVEEASAALSLADGYKIELPIYIDTEGSGGRADSLDVETRTAVCRAFCRTIENAGKKSGVYASRHWFYNMVQAEELEQSYIWLAEYRDAPLYQGYYQMWQYTSRGHVDGIDGNVDLDIGYIPEE